MLNVKIVEILLGGRSDRLSEVSITIREEPFSNRGSYKVIGLVVNFYASRLMPSLGRVDDSPGSDDHLGL